MDKEKAIVRIRVVIADDHPIVRDGLKKLLSIEGDIDVVGEAADGQELLAFFPHLESASSLRQLSECLRLMSRCCWASSRLL